MDLNTFLLIRTHDDKMTLTVLQTESHKHKHTLFFCSVFFFFRMDEFGVSAWFFMGERVVKRAVMAAEEINERYKY